MGGNLSGEDSFLFVLDSFVTFSGFRNHFLSNSGLHDCNPFLNSNPKNQILAFTKLKGFADNKMNAAKRPISISDTVENIEGKGEYSLFSNIFLKAPSTAP